MIILAVYTMRKRGLTLAEAVKHGKYHVTRRGAPPPPPKKLQSNWDQKQDYVDSGYGSMRNDAVTAPQAAASLGRSGSNSSQRPLMALERSDRYVSLISSQSAEDSKYGRDYPSALQLCLHCFVSVSIAWTRHLRGASLISVTLNLRKDGSDVGLS